MRRIENELYLGIKVVVSKPDVIQVRLGAIQLSQGAVE